MHLILPKLLICATDLYTCVLRVFSCLFLDVDQILPYMMYLSIHKIGAADYGAHNGEKFPCFNKLAMVPKEGSSASEASNFFLV